MCIDIYDDTGIGGGASGAAGGLLHPYSPKGSLICSCFSSKGSKVVNVMVITGPYNVVFFFFIFESLQFTQFEKQSIRKFHI